MYSPLRASVPIGNEKATVAAVAFYGASQRSSDIQNTSTKVLSVQGQSIKNHQNSINLTVVFEKMGVTNTKGGWQH